MSSIKQQLSPHGINWEVSALRCSVFFKDVKEASPTWEKIFKTKPTNINIQAKESCVVEIDELSENLSVQLITRVERSDLIFFANQQVFDNHEIPSIGSFKKSIDDFEKFLTPWLKNHSDITRIAFGGSLTTKVQDKKEGYLLLDKLLPFVQVPDADKASDFIFRVNRPRISTVVQDLKINRLTTWQCMHRHISIMQDKKLQSFPRTQFVIIELDINTDYEYDKIIPTQKIKNLCEELKNLSQEIADFGDIE